jgi:hypothetical protein
LLVIKLPGGDQHAGRGVQLALGHHCCGLWEAVSCTIAAHHAYLSSSAPGTDSLHTFFLYSECELEFNHLFLYAVAGKSIVALRNNL